MAAAANPSMDLDVDYFAICISGIFLNINPHLHTATHGFEKAIVASGHKIENPKEGFYVVFDTKTSRAIYMKNSKWLKGLRKSHKEANVTNLMVKNVTYKVRDGFLKPFFNLDFIPSEMKDFYCYSDEEVMIVEYVRSRTSSNAHVGVDLCKDVLEQPVSCNKWRLCTRHISKVILTRNVALELEKKGHWDKAMELLQSGVEHISRCPNNRCRLPAVVLLNLQESLYRNVYKEKNKAENCQFMISTYLSKAYENSEGIPENKTELAKHTISFVAHTLNLKSKVNLKWLVELCVKQLESPCIQNVEDEDDRDKPLMLKASKILLKILEDRDTLKEDPKQDSMANSTDSLKVMDSQMLLDVSPNLARIIGTKEGENISNYDAVGKVLSYINTNNLWAPVWGHKPNLFTPDALMEPVFGKEIQNSKFISNCLKDHLKVPNTEFGDTPTYRNLQIDRVDEDQRYQMRRRESPSNELFVGRIPQSDTITEDLKELFGQYGKITNVRITKKTTVKKENQKPVPWNGIITFETPNAVERAIAAKPIMLFGTHRLNVEEMKEKKSRGPTKHHEQELEISLGLTSDKNVANENDIKENKPSTRSPSDPNKGAIPKCSTFKLDSWSQAIPKETKSIPAGSSSKSDEGSQDDVLQKFSQLSLSGPKEEAIKLCTGFQKISDSDIEVEILGVGPVTANVFDINIFDADCLPVSWMNTNMQDFCDVLVTGMREGRNFVTVAVTADNQIVKLWVKDCVESDLVEQPPSPVKTVTFANDHDVFGETEDYEDDAIEDLESADNILSMPSTNDDLLTVGNNISDEFLEKLEPFIIQRLGQRTRGAERPAIKDTEKNIQLANTMVNSLRNQDWLEDYLEVLKRSWDPKTGKHRNPSDVSDKDIYDFLQENYNNQSVNFNKNMFLRMTSQLIANVASVYLGERQFERMQPQPTDDQLIKEFKLSFVELFNTKVLNKVSFDDVIKILEENNVTIPFLKQGWNRPGNFEEFLNEHFNLDQETFSEFEYVFRKFFTKHDLQQSPMKRKAKDVRGSTTMKHTACSTVDDLSVQDCTNPNTPGLLKKHINPIYHHEDDIINVDGNIDAASPRIPTSPIKILSSSESLFVSNLPANVTESELNKLFSKYGRVVSVRIKRNIQGIPIHSFIGFDEAASVGKALKDRPILIRDTKLKVMEKKEKKSNSPETSVEEDFIESSSQADDKAGRESETEDMTFKYMQTKLSILLTRMNLDLENYQNPAFKSKANQLVKEATDLKAELEGTGLGTELSVTLDMMKAIMEKNLPEMDERSGCETKECQTEDHELFDPLVKEERDNYRNLYFNLKSSQAREAAETSELILKLRNTIKDLNEKQETLQEHVNTAITKLEFENKSLQDKNAQLQKEKDDMEADVKNLKVVFREMKDDKDVKEKPTKSKILVRFEDATVLLSPNGSGLLALEDVQDWTSPRKVSCIMYSVTVEESKPRILHLAAKCKEVRRMLLLEEGMFHPPDDGWGQRVYEVIASIQSGQLDVKSPTFLPTTKVATQTSFPIQPAEPLLVSKIPQVALINTFSPPQLAAKSPKPIFATQLKGASSSSNPPQLPGLVNMSHLDVSTVLHLFPPPFSGESWSFYQARMLDLIDRVSLTRKLSPMQINVLMEQLLNKYLPHFNGPQIVTNVFGRKL